MKPLFLLIAVLWSLPINAQVHLQGTVKDATGKAPIVSDIHIGQPGADATSYACSKDGTFEIKLPKAGYYQLRASAVNHQEVSVPLIVRETDKKIELNLQLRPNEYTDSYEKVRIIGDWNNFKFSGTDTMTRSGSKFIYTRTAEADSVGYQLLDIAGGHSVNGTHADHFVYDGGGDYRSVVKTKKGDQVLITFDPEKIVYPKNESLPKVDFAGNQLLNTIYILNATAASMRAKAMVIPPGGGAATMNSTKYREIIDYLRAEFEKAKDKEVAQFAAVTLANEFNPTVPFDSALAKKILDAVPASSPMWAIAPYAVFTMCDFVSKDLAAAYKADLVASNPSPTIRALVYADRLAQAYEAKDKQVAKELYDFIKKEYSNISEIKYTLQKYNPDAVIQVGRKIPAFELDLLDASSAKVSNASMLGKFYMIDFWATWCGPCVREMPAIHKAYARFKGRKGFDILSVSMDGSVAQIAPFRKKWKMPWMHAFIPGVFDAEMAKQFEVAGIPKPVLVDASGNVVAMQEELRGENLEQTLEKFLSGEN